MQSLRSLIASPSGLFAFEAAARLRSFTAAGRELNVTQAAISFAVKQLEEALGVALFLRHHKKIELTDVGERFFHDVALGLNVIRRSAEEMTRQRRDRHVTLSVFTGFATYWMMPRLGAFRAAHPAIELRLLTSDKDVDLQAEGIDLGIRRGDGKWPDCGAALLAAEEIYPVCSPSYRPKQRGLSAGALAGLDLIHLEEPFRLAKYTMLAMIVGIFALVMVLATLLSLRWARSIFKPIESMNHTIAQVEDGDSDARVGPVQARDEVGALANHLDQLLDVIDDKTRALQHWADELDNKVVERTRDLAASNNALQQVQRQLVKSEKLAAIGQIAASVAHEINNPIAVIQGNLDLMREALGDQAVPVAAELQLLDQQVDRMRLIVTELLQYARPTEYAGYVDAVDVNHAIDGALLLVGHLLAHADVGVERDTRASIRAGINPQELQQVLINLISNALQAMPQGGRLWLGATDRVDAQGRSGVALEVGDSGAGLDERARERLFRPFFTTRTDGNGLGLWISLGLVERYGGSIRGENWRERGTDRPGAVFTVWLLRNPVAPGSEGSGNDGDEPPDGGKPA